MDDGLSWVLEKLALDQTLPVLVFDVLAADPVEAR
jgi:hypothetical protein